MRLCCGQAKSTGQLLQSLAVFKACTIKPLVNNADTLLAASRQLAPSLVDHAVKHTFFRHFCGGECVESIQPTLQASLAAVTMSTARRLGGKDITMSMRAGTRSSSLALG